jgi:hypothetical protein
MTEWWDNVARMRAKVPLATQHVSHLSLCCFVCVSTTDCEPMTFHCASSKLLPAFAHVTTSKWDLLNTTLEIKIRTHISKEINHNQMYN